MIDCWNCAAPLELSEASWCGCSPTHPTKICPFCYACACSAPEPYLLQYRELLPQSMMDEFNSSAKPRHKLGELLMSQGRLTEAQLTKFLQLQKLTGNKLGELLVQYGITNQDELARILAEQQDMPTIEIEPRKLKASLIMAVDPRVCLKYKFVPIDLQDISYTSKMLIIAVAEPIPAADLERIGQALGYKMYQKFALPEQVLDALARIKKLLMLSLKQQQQSSSPQQDW